MKTKPDKKTLLVEWLDQHNATHSTYQQMKDLFDCNPECKAVSSMSTLFDKYTKLVSEKVGDKGEWLEWYLWDNEAGKRGSEVTINGKKIKVKNLDDLLKVIGN